MSPFACTLVLALLTQPATLVDRQQQQELEATLATDEGWRHVKRYVNQERFFPYGFVPLIAPATQSDDQRVQWRALDILKEIGPDAASHDEVVYPFLSHEDSGLRMVAVECLGAMHPGRFFPEIAHMAVLDEDNFVQGTAVKVLSRSESLQAVPFILAVYLDEEPQRAAHAIRFSQECSPELQRALVPGLVQILGRSGAAYITGSIEVRGATYLRADALDVLGSMGEIAADYLPEIIRMQELEEDPAIQIRYAAAIINIGGVDKKQVDLVRQFLESGTDQLQALACQACLDSPLLTEPLQDSLVALADHNEPGVRERVSLILRNIELTEPDVIAALEFLSTDYADSLRRETCWNALYALADRGALDDPLEHAVTAMHETTCGELYAYLFVEHALGREAAIAAIVDQIATADSTRREQLIEMLIWGHYFCEQCQELTEAYRLLLELPLSDDEHELLTEELEFAIEMEASREPITDWHLPAEEAPSISP